MHGYTLGSQGVRVTFQAGVGRGRGGLQEKGSTEMLRFVPKFIYGPWVESVESVEKVEPMPERSILSLEVLTPERGENCREAP